MSLKESSQHSAIRRERKRMTDVGAALGDGSSAEIGEAVSEGEV